MLLDDFNSGYTSHSFTCAESTQWRIYYQEHMMNNSDLVQLVKAGLWLCDNWKEKHWTAFWHKLSTKKPALNPAAGLHCIKFWNVWQNVWSSNATLFA